MRLLDRKKGGEKEKEKKKKRIQLTEFTKSAHVVRVAANELRVDFPVGFTARQPLELRGMPEVRPPEHFVEQHGERVRLLTHFGVHFAGQEQAGASGSPLGLHRLQKHL